jgi:outer membrane receptor protein involved in Fe transport
MKLRINLLVIALLGGLYTFGQSVSGIVQNESKAGIQGVYVYTPNHKQHVHTNGEGAFTISNVKINDTLIFSHISYISDTIIIKDNQLLVELKKVTLQLDAVEIKQHTKSINILTEVQLKSHPVKSSQELLNIVPGLIIGQHAGGGKAEQLFLRGYDIDHGTDIAISFDGMPVNMVSHAHGQGYADLHFVIPETVKDIEFGKGPYDASQGNFATAGYVSLASKDQLENSLVSMEAGSFNSSRLLAMINLISEHDHRNMYVATEFMLSDGPFESPQDFNRINLFAKYSERLHNNDLVKIQASHFQSKWNASGQIPQRAINLGMITRWGAIDDTEGGQTSRSNVSVEHLRQINKHTFLSNQLYYSNYAFDLYSNFTFFLEDSINGDQIHQKEERNIFGSHSSLSSIIKRDKFKLKSTFGIGFRYDEISDVELSHTLNRKQTLNQIQLGDVFETNLFAYANFDFDFGKLLINPSLRFDYFNFEYTDHLDANYNAQSLSGVLPSPKLNFIYSPSTKVQFFLKNGIGFHSNDTRVSIAKKAEEVLPMVLGNDLGMIWKPFGKLIIHTAAYSIISQQEFVYVGDAGVIEPSGRSKRMGIDFGTRFQLKDKIFVYADVNYCFARAMDELEGENYIPLAPDFTATAGISAQIIKNLDLALRMRFVDHRPANEDNSIVAEGYCIFDANINYQYRNWRFSLIAENLLNQEWNETQFATESRLQNEIQSYEEIHFIPGNPFGIKAKMSYFF